MNQKQLKIGVFDPYFDILGGGERYIFTIAQCLSKKHQVAVFWHQKDLLEKAEKKFNFNFPRFKIINPLNFWEKLTILPRYDLAFFVTDGSLFFSQAKKNILIIQSPAHIPPLTLVNRIKMPRWGKVICYSKFMAEIIKKKLGRKPEVLFVPVKLDDFKIYPKENIILSVGRFFPHLHSKKQKELVKIFKEMTKNLTNWQLILVGSVDQGSMGYLEEVKKKVKNLPVKILTDISFAKLKKLYGKAKIYWHGTGFGEDLKAHPERAEHFGVTTVEAMASGCVPIVFNGGGQREIVQNGKDGFLWETAEELIGYTLKLVHDEKLREKMSKEAIKKSRQFSKKKFCQRIDKLISSII